MRSPSRSSTPTTSELGAVAAAEGRLRGQARPRRAGAVRLGEPGRDQRARGPPSSSPAASCAVRRLRLISARSVPSTGSADETQDLGALGHGDEVDREALDELADRRVGVGTSRGEQRLGRLRPRASAVGRRSAPAVAGALDEQADAVSEAPDGEHGCQAEADRRPAHARRHRGRGGRSGAAPAQGSRRPSSVAGSSRPQADRRRTARAPRGACGPPALAPARCGYGA